MLSALEQEENWPKKPMVTSEIHIKDRKPEMFIYWNKNNMYYA